MVREALEQHPDIRISKNDIHGNVEFLINSQSSLTSAKILKDTSGKTFFFMPKTMQIEVIEEPKFKYQITFKQETTPDIMDTVLRDVVRTKLLRSLDCQKVFFSTSAIEVWSDKEIGTSKLADESILQTHHQSVYGGGIESVEQLLNPKAKNRQ